MSRGPGSTGWAHPIAGPDERSVAVRNAIIGAAGVLLAAAPAAGNAQIGADAVTGPGPGTVSVAPPGATIGGIAGGPAIRAPRPYHRDSAHPDRRCWHDRGS